MKHAFLLGAIGYPAIELAYRGRTHYSMALAGGCSAVFVERIRRFPIRTMEKAILGAAAITGVEYICGSIWNRNFAVWDYRNMPMNLHGQVCLPFTLLWLGLSFGMIKVFDFVDEKQGRT